jgi:hypothetical protein
MHAAALAADEVPFVEFKDLVVNPDGGVTFADINEFNFSMIM